MIIIVQWALFALVPPLGCHLFSWIAAVSHQHYLIDVPCIWKLPVLPQSLKKVLRLLLEVQDYFLLVLKRSVIWIENVQFRDQLFLLGDLIGVTEAQIRRLGATELLYRVLQHSDCVDIQCLLFVFRNELRREVAPPTQVVYLHAFQVSILLHLL